MIIYTSGTTNKPKGVVTTHRNIVAQITSLISAWGWSPHDYRLNVLLERYGMTEIGMALSNPLHHECRAGFVGAPLPGVAVRLVGAHGEEVRPGTAGEIQIKGQNVFLKYWGNPAATQQAFCAGWFCTGDMAVVEDGYFRILGRAAIDIIKTGGYKVSALEIEEVLRTHPDIVECAVVGIPDPHWGERVGATLVLQPDKKIFLTSLKGWARTQIATYKIPTAIITLADLPRNAMGKVIKSEVVRLLQSSEKSSQ